MSLIDSHQLEKHKIRNVFHTLVFVVAMLALTAMSASLLFEEGVWPWVLAGSALASIHHRLMALRKLSGTVTQAHETTILCAD